MNIIIIKAHFSGSFIFIAFCTMDHFDLRNLNVHLRHSSNAGVQSGYLCVCLWLYGSILLNHWSTPLDNLTFTLSVCLSLSFSLSCTSPVYAVGVILALSLTACCLSVMGRVCNTNTLSTERDFKCNKLPATQQCNHAEEGRSIQTLRASFCWILQRKQNTR